MSERMRSKIYVLLPDGVGDLLREMARRELRDPQTQAAWLILDGLRRAGMDPDAKAADGTDYWLQRRHDRED